MRKPDFLERMALGKEHAQDRRNRGEGAGTVRVFASTAAYYQSIGNPEHDGFDEYLARVRDRVSEAIESYRHALFGDEWRGGEDEIPF